ncbi:MAG: LamG domain-containing protein, partial [Planctomycetes bacterium]|nr:LamG domain-containing protein [Planctomycetota bacterium]
MMIRAIFGMLSLVVVIGARADLVARWTFDKEGGDGLRDTSGSFPAKISNESGQAGIRRAGERTFFSLPGTHAGDCVTLGEGDTFNLPRQFTLEAWFRPHPAPERSYTMILGKRYNRQFQLSWASSEGGTIEFYVGGGDLKRQRNWQSRAGTGRWLHIVAVYDSTVIDGPNQRLYVDGRLAHENCNEVKLAADAGALRIGQNSDMNLKSGVSADWDEVAVYDHPLSAEEVAAAYAEKPNPSTTITGPSWTLPLPDLSWETSVDTPARKATERDAMSGIVRRGQSAVGGEKSLASSATGLLFQIAGNPPERVVGEWRWKPELPLDLSAFHYCLVRYRAKGLQRAITPLPVLKLEGAGGGTTVLTSSHLILDDRAHTCLVKLNLAENVEAVLIDLRTQGSEAELELQEVRFLRRPEVSTVGAPKVSSTAPFAAVQLPVGWRRPLQEVFQKALSGEGHAVHDPVGLGGLPAVLEGIPFSPAEDGTVWWPPEEDPNAEQV